MADAAAPAVRARALLPDLGGLTVGVAAAAGLGVLGAADGGYFPPAWGWTALFGLWIAAAWLLLDRAHVRTGVLDLAFMVGLVGLACWTWLSLIWTANTVQTVLDGLRVLAYVGAVAALLAVVRRGNAAAVLRGTLAAIALVSTYSLATRLFPDRLGFYDPIATYRLSEPLGYWNGLGVFAAMGVLLALGLAVRDRNLLARSLAGAALPILLCVMLFTFSRGAWIALGLAVLAVIALDPRRLQLVAGAFVVGVPGAIAVAVAVTAQALTERDSPLRAAADQGRVVAVIVALCCAGGAVAAVLFAIAERRVRPARSVRLAFAAVLAVLAVGAAGTVMVQFGGPVALVDEAYDSFRAPPPPDPNELELRLFSFSGNYRTQLWAAAWDQFRANPVNGEGAGTYEDYWNEHRPRAHIVRDAHSLYLETLGELGVVGAAFLALALGAPLLAAFGARRDPLAAAAFGAYVAYLVHAAVDWDWELTAVTLAALACVAVLLVLRPRAEGLLPGTALRTVAAVVAIALAGVAFVGLVGSSAASASQRASEASPPDLVEAKEQARKARRWAPWSSEPWQRLGEAQLAGGELADARASFRKAIEKEPTDWLLWFRLAEASSGAERRQALARATRLNPRSPEIRAFVAGER